MDMSSIPILSAKQTRRLFAKIAIERFAAQAGKALWIAQRDTLWQCTWQTI